ncbi:DUF4358 domain-containing protein [Clostridium paraputrificum]|uniref:DUF4358 domain-containing protein n=1 Tax=Clostridium paraputrificum TaxID=29363 RepID=UPI003D324AB6
MIRGRNRKKSRYRKYYLMEIVVIVVTFVLLYPLVKVKDANMDSIRSTLEAKVNSEIVKVGTEKDLKKIYNIDSKDIEEFVSFIPKSNMDAEEFLILKVKDEKMIPVTKEKIQSRIDKQGENFKNYRPEKYEVIRNAVLENEGRYIIFIISEEDQIIKEEVKEEFR